LNNSVELELANLHLNELVLESITFDDGDPLEGSFSTSTNARIALDMWEEEEEEERAVVVMPILMIMTWRTLESRNC
jgi:hypothetical protein